MTVIVFVSLPEAAPMNPLKWRWLGVAYEPRPAETPFLERAEVRQDDEMVVRLAVLDDRESDRFFGVPLARRGIQPVWLHIQNIGRQSFRLRVASLDRNYYPPLEAAYACHFRFLKRILGYGLLIWFLMFILPFLFLLVIKLFAARLANRRMNDFFQAHGIGWGLIKPGTELSGFVFTSLDEGTKQVAVRLVAATQVKEFAFSIPIPGLRVDHGGKQFDALVKSADAVECDEADLRRRLAAFPRSTTNHRGTKEGDPLNLCVIGDFDTIIGGFGARWDETETIDFKSCMRTFKAFVLGSNYRYSPVEFALRRRPAARFRAAKDATFDQRTAAPAAVADSPAFERQTGLDRANQPGYRCPVHDQNLEPDHAQNRSGRGRRPGLRHRRSNGSRPNIVCGSSSRSGAGDADGAPAQPDRRSVFHGRPASGCRVFRNSNHAHLARLGVSFVKSFAGHCGTTRKHDTQGSPELCPRPLPSALMDSAG